jgi:hypothetical protein
MATERVSKVVYADGCLHLVLASDGEDAYQYIYREAKSVYWDPDRKSFKCSTSIPGLPIAQLLTYVARITNEFGVTLDFSSSPEFVDVPDDVVEVLMPQVIQLISGCS